MKPLDPTQTLQQEFGLHSQVLGRKNTEALSIGNATLKTDLLNATLTFFQKSAFKLKFSRGSLLRDIQFWIKYTFKQLGMRRERKDKIQS